MNMRKQDVKDLIEKELASMSGEHPDEEFVAGNNNDSGPRFLESKERISEEEAIIDELLLSVPKSQGYYLKLSKEIRPNEYEFKLRIDNYENWSDLEFEISNIVRSYTSKSPSKWGSGHYRVTIWRDGGLRGPKHKPIDFFVDALEIDLPGNNIIAGKVDVESQLASMSGLIDSVKKIMPQQETLSPGEVQKMISESYLQGMANASQKASDNANSSNAMMAGMFTLIAQMMQNMNQRPEPIAQPNPTEQLAKLTEIMANLGLGPAKNVEKPKSLVDSIQELKLLGLWKEPKDEDPIAKIAEMKNLMSLVTDLTGGMKGERPSTIEKIIDVLGPQVPEMIGKVTGTINNAIDYSKARMGLPQTKQAPVRIVRSNPQLTGNDNGNGNGNNQTVTEDPTTMFYNKLFIELHQIISTNDHSKFPYIAEQLVKLFGNEQVLVDIVEGRLAPEAISNMLSVYGGTKFKDTVFIPQMHKFITEFCNWVKEQNELGDTNDYVVTCSICKSEYEYASQLEFDSDANKICGFDSGNGVVCTGTLVEHQISIDKTQPIQHVEKPLAGPYDKEKSIDALSPY